jgi:hypothetical protein
VLEDSRKGLDSAKRKWITITLVFYYAFTFEPRPKYNMKNNKAPEGIDTTYLDIQDKTKETSD